MALDPVADLKRRLARGPRQLRPIVLRWWREQRLGEHPAAVGKRIAVALLEQKQTPAKLAGVLLLQEPLADCVRASDLPTFARLFEREQLTDNIVVDWFGTRVLGTMLQHVRGRSEVARALVAWRNADNIWQRRAACVAFTSVARQGDAAMPGLAQLIFTLCSAVVWSLERRDQSAVATLLSELSRAEPTRVEAFVRRHARFMSRECVRGSIERLPVDKQHDLLRHFERATRL